MKQDWHQRLWSVGVILLMLAIFRGGFLLMISPDFGYAYPGDAPYPPPYPGNVTATPTPIRTSTPPPPTATAEPKKILIMIGLLTEMDSVTQGIITQLQAVAVYFPDDPQLAELIAFFQGGVLLCQQTIADLLGKTSIAVALGSA